MEETAGFCWWIFMCGTRWNKDWIRIPRRWLWRWIMLRSDVGDFIVAVRQSQRWEAWALINHKQTLLMIRVQARLLTFSAGEWIVNRNRPGIGQSSDGRMLCSFFQLVQKRYINYNICSRRCTLPQLFNSSRRLPKMLSRHNYFWLTSRLTSSFSSHCQSERKHYERVFNGCPSSHLCHKRFASLVW